VARRQLGSDGGCLAVVARCGSVVRALARGSASKSATGIGVGPAGRSPVGVGHADRSRGKRPVVEEGRPQPRSRSRTRGRREGALEVNLELVAALSNPPLQRTAANVARSEAGPCRDGAGCARASSRPWYARRVRSAAAAERQDVRRTRDTSS
jgi:hypothetical protein